MTIDVLIADDEPLVRTGLRTILEAEPDIAVTGEAADGAAELIIGEATVKTHVTRILAKLEVRDRVQAVILAYETGAVGSLRSGSPGER